MPRPLPLLLLGCVVGIASGPCGAQTGAARIDGIALIALRDGVNQVRNFMPGGGTATIVQAWRGNGNAHGYQDWLVLAPGGEGHDAAVVTHMNPGDHRLTDLVSASPFDGEQVLSTVRFARARVNGAPASLMIDAELDPAPSGVLADHATATIRIYRLVATDGEPGDSPHEFRLISTRRTSARFCNADLALSRALGLPLPAGESDLARSADGCQSAQ